MTGDDKHPTPSGVGHGLAILSNFIDKNMSSIKVISEKNMMVIAKLLMSLSQVDMLIVAPCRLQGVLWEAWQYFTSTGDCTS